MRVRWASVWQYLTAAFSHSPAQQRQPLLSHISGEHLSYRTRFIAPIPLVVLSAKYPCQPSWIFKDYIFFLCISLLESRCRINILKFYTMSLLKCIHYAGAANVFCPTWKLPAQQVFHSTSFVISTTSMEYKTYTKALSDTFGNFLNTDTLLFCQKILIRMFISIVFIQISLSNNNVINFKLHFLRAYIYFKNLLI